MVMLQKPVPTVPLTAPCPCGSGRKYKRCCWTRERRDFAEVLTEIHEAPAIVARFAGDPFPDLVERAVDELRMAAIAFTDEESVEQAWEELGPLATNLGIESALVDIPAFGRHTAVETFLLAEESHALRATTREYLEALGRSAFSLYEVEEVRRDEGVVLKDLLRKRRFEVYDRSYSRELRQWEVIFARLVEMDGLCLASDFGMQIERRHLGTILETLPDYKAGLRARSLSWQRFFKREWTLAFALWVRMNFRQSRPPMLANTEGDPLMQIDLEWEVVPGKVPELRRRLDGAEELQSDDHGSWVFLGPGTGAFSQGVLRGAIELEGDTLSVSVNSERREKEITAYLKELAGDCLGHSSRTAIELTPENIERLSREHRVSREPAPEVPPELEEQLLHEVLQRHYTAWVHESLPALGGKTPTEAAADPAMREKLVALLKDLELHHATAPPPMGTYDPSWLWEELGLHRP